MAEPAPVLVCIEGKRLPLHRICAQDRGQHERQVQINFGTGNPEVSAITPAIPPAGDDHPAPLESISAHAMKATRSDF
jgi:hypothetical protein